MKSNKRLFIEKYFSGFVYVLEKNGVSIDSIEQELSLAIEKDDVVEKFTDWEYMLKSAIYLSLIGYADSNGHSIPCKVRGQIEAAILKRFKQNMKGSNYNPPQPPLK